MSRRTFLSRAPVRADAAGGGTDAPPFCLEHGGTVVNIAVAAYVTATVEVLPDSREATIRSIDFEEEVSAGSVGDFKLDGQLDLLKGIAMRMAPPWGFKLTVESGVRPGSGLGSSGAVGVAVVGVFDRAMGAQRSQAETARLANEIERIDLGASGGNQDSYGPALGGVNHLVYYRGGGMDARKIELSASTRHELEDRCVLVDTGEVHLSGNIHDDIKAAYALPDSPVVDAMKHLARIGEEVAGTLQRGDVDRFGELLSENWHHHKRLHQSCDSAELRRFYAGVEGQVVGGKTCGAGGGGCVLFVAREGCREAVEELCRDMGGEVIPFRISPTGLETRED